jgi:hypothetical protein
MVATSPVGASAARDVNIIAAGGRSYKPRDFPET